MSKGNEKKAEALGMSFGAASSRLRKNLLFSLVVELGRDTCYRCGENISSVDEFSIEHKEAWLQTEDPLKSFFDLGNVSFSHLKCNVGAARKPSKRWRTEEGRKRIQAEVERKRWRKLPREEQQRIRREKYVRNGR
jgi:hypothetical protein